MNLTIRTKILGHDLYLRIGRLRKVLGVNSTLDSGLHILMWEFDDVEASQVIDALGETQRSFALPNIYILSSHGHRSFHGYCLIADTFRRTLAMVAATDHVDMDWMRMCMARGHWTLRLSDKGHGAPMPLAYLESKEEEEVSINETSGGVLYEAWERARRGNAG